MNANFMITLLFIKITKLVNYIKVVIKLYVYESI